MENNGRPHTEQDGSNKAQGPLVPGTHKVKEQGKGWEGEGLWWKQMK